MAIEAATEADLEDLAPLFAAYLAFYRVAKPLAEVRTFLATRLRRGDSTIIIARDEQGLAQGFVQLYPQFASLALRPAWLLSDLYVDAAARRQGIGEALMNAARAHAEASGACGLQLETARTNLAGQALYERLGYVRDQVFYTYWLELPGQTGR
ncbi:GNAT family N-acetyltransferase [Pseudomonas zhanjiangensis]|uniref:N-acetyltransferase family protein n=1 Tax=Pseudomonas zhanjiangensis TaxID=3239015 RepID=A0ABV3YU82_9PSED